MGNLGSAAAIYDAELQDYVSIHSEAMQDLLIRPLGTHQAYSGFSITPIGSRIKSSTNFYRCLVVGIIPLTDPRLSSGFAQYYSSVWTAVTGRIIRLGVHSRTDMNIANVARHTRHSVR